MAGGYTAGGSLILAELLDEHGEKIYFDLHRYVGLNLVDLLSEGSTYSPREIVILILNLPIDSATMAAIQGGSEFRGWGIGEYQQAAMIDAIQQNTYAVVAANTDKKSKMPKPPERAYRPGNKQANEKKTNSFATMASAFYKAAVKE